MVFLKVEGLEYSWADKLTIPGISFELPRGAFVSLLGPSGSGKSTLLRLIAGLETPHNGTIVLKDKSLLPIPTQQRGIGMVFQQPSLFPSMSVFDNVAFGIAHLTHDLVKARVHEMLVHVNLHHKADAYPHELSGGQQHRVALARALAPSPKLLLLDEPFAHLDAVLRESLRHDTRALIKRAGVTCLMVTHDATEAMQLSDKIILMDDTGHIRQTGTPHDVYHHPRDVYCAQSLGAVNILTAHSDGTMVQSALGEFPLHADYTGQVCLAIRPSDIHVTDENVLAHVVIKSLVHTGPQDYLELALKDGDILYAHVAHEHHYKAGDKLGIALNMQHVQVLPN